MPLEELGDARGYLRLQPNTEMSGSFHKDGFTGRDSRGCGPGVGEGSIDVSGAVDDEGGADDSFERNRSEIAEDQSIIAVSRGARAEGGEDTEDPRHQGARRHCTGDPCHGVKQREKAEFDLELNRGPRLRSSDRGTEDQGTAPGRMTRREGHREGSAAGKTVHESRWNSKRIEEGSGEVGLLRHTATRR